MPESAALCHVGRMGQWCITWRLQEQEARLRASPSCASGLNRVKVCPHTRPCTLQPQWDRDFSWRLQEDSPALVAELRPMLEVIEVRVRGRRVACTNVVASPQPLPAVGAAWESWRPLHRQRPQRINP